MSDDDLKAELERLRLRRRHVRIVHTADHSLVLDELYPYPAAAVGAGPGTTEARIS